MPINRSSRRPAFRAGVSAALLAIASNVNASGFALLEQSASRLGTAFSGTAAAADDATTIFYNPAGLLQLRETELTVVATGVDIGSQFRNGNSLAALGQPLGVEGGDAGGWNAVPAVYAALPLTKDLALGFGFNVPFGLKLEYDTDWIGRFQALKSEIQTYNFNPALAFRLNDHVSLGFGMDFQRILAELTNSVNYTAAIGSVSPVLVPSNLGLTGAAVVRGDDSAWGFNAGVMFEFTPQTRLGLSYRSPLHYQIEGSVRFTPPAANNPAGQQIINIVSAPGGPLSTSLATVDLKLPDIATASFYQRIGGRMELLADVAWTGWSSVQELRIVRDTGQVVSVTPELWEDTWRYALGIAVDVSPTWKLRGGVAFDETAVPDSTRTPRLPDSERQWVAIGARWLPTNATVIDVAYAYLFSDDVGLNQNAGSTAANGLLNGQQESDVNIVSLQVGYRF
ncbi:MAG TPA: outer membrane protein transport protein [Povalibacter sp.]